MSHAALIKRAIPEYFLQTTEERRDAILGEKINISPMQGFIYLKNGATALDVDHIVQTSAPVVADSNIPAAVSLGADTFQIAATGVTEDQYAGGVMFVYGGTGQGTRVGIMSNTATVGGNITIRLVSDLPVALDTTSDVRLIGSLFNNVVEGTDSRNLALGTAIQAVPANRYFWAGYGVTQGIANADIASGANDGTPIIKAATGEFAAQPDTNLKREIGMILQSGAITANDVVSIFLNPPGV